MLWTRMKIGGIGAGNPRPWANRSPIGHEAWTNSGAILRHQGLLGTWVYIIYVNCCGPIKDHRKHFWYDEMRDIHLEPISKHLKERIGSLSEVRAFKSVYHGLSVRRARRRKSPLGSSGQRPRWHWPQSCAYKYLMAWLDIFAIIVSLPPYLAPVSSMETSQKGFERVCPSQFFSWKYRLNSEPVPFFFFSNKWAARLP